jgi:small subunit ribosomal protein S20
MSKKTEISKNIKRRKRNKLIKADIKDAGRELRKAGQKKDAVQAEAKLGELIPKIDRAARKGAVHKKAAARKISRLSKQANALKSSAQAE